MKKQNNIKGLFLFGILILAHFGAMAQPDWEVNAPDFQFTMTVTGVGLFSCEETIEPDDMVGAFIGGECRGISAFDTDVDGKLMAYLTVYDNETGGSEVTFKLYKSASDEIIDGPMTLTFSEGAIFGHAAEPFRFRTQWAISSLYLAADSLLDNYVAGTDVGEVFMINEADETLEGSFSFIDDELGPDNASFSFLTSFLILESDVNFAEQDTFQIHIEGLSESGCTFDQVIVLPVFNTNVGPIGLLNDSLQIVENSALGTLVADLEADDETPNDSHVFMIIGSGTALPDMDAFEMDSPSLYTAALLDYEKQIWYYLEIEITDAAGNTVIDTLVVEVLDEIEYDDLKASNLLTPDNDGHNDFLVIPNVALYQNFTLYVFNAMGSEVYQTDDYDNTWNGVSNNGNELASGTYYYLFRDKGNEDNKFRGDIHIYRSNKF